MNNVDNTTKNLNIGGLTITYSNPCVTMFSENMLMKDIHSYMYFYYDISISRNNKEIFSARTHDCPKVPSVSDYIDYLLNIRERDMLLLENINRDGYTRRVYFYLVELKDYISYIGEYYYRIEKTITYVKGSDDYKPQKYEAFNLRIGKSFLKDGEPIDAGEEIVIALNKEELLKFKKLTTDFCDEVVLDYNKILKDRTVECPKCKSELNYLKTATAKDKYSEVLNKCTKCDLLFDMYEDYND